MNKRSSDHLSQDDHLLRFTDQSFVDEVAQLLQRAERISAAKRTMADWEEILRRIYQAAQLPIRSNQG